MSEVEGKLIELRRKVLRRFYEPLLLLHSLGQVRGARTKPELHFDSSGPNHQKIRRSFADGIAYICAYDKGPDYVTASALEKSPEGIIVWLAANAEIKPKVITFLERTLDDLSHIAAQGDSSDRQRTGLQSQENILTRIVAFNQNRIQAYYKLAKSFTTSCLAIIREHCQSTRFAQEGETNISELHNWLCKYFGSDRSSALDEAELQNLVRECHRVRKASLLDLLKPFTGQGQTRHFEFEQLYKLLCKLGKHVTVTRKLIESAMSLPQDFNQGFIIERVPSSKFQKLPLTGKEATIESTAGRMFSNSVEKDKFLARLKSVWNTDELSKLLAQEISSKTRVHAELLLVNHFDKQGCNFIDGDDKYIGCSKPACYLCYAYISNHPGRYALPPSHQKIYVGWRIPDIYSNEAQSHERLSTQEKVLLSMIEWIRRDVKADMESRNPQRPYHADSTAGITSIVDKQNFEVGPLLNSLSLNDANVNAPELEHPNINEFDIEEYEQGAFENSDDDGGVQL